MKIIYDYKDENNYHSFTYRTTSVGKVYACLDEVANGEVKADSKELVITNVVGSNLKKYQAPANVNSGIFGTLNITSNRIIDSHQVTICYLSETEIEFKLSYIDTETSQSIVVAQFVIKNESKNYFSNKVNIKLYTNREVHINDVEIVPQTKGEIKNYFADWSKIDENGKIENNQIVK